MKGKTRLTQEIMMTTMRSDLISHQPPSNHDAGMQKRNQKLNRIYFKERKEFEEANLKENLNRRNRDIWDLNYTLASQRSLQITMGLLLSVFFSSRFYVMLCMVYIMIKERTIIWLIPIFGTRAAYWVTMMRLVFVDANSKSQQLLIPVWSCRKVETGSISEQRLKWLSVLWKMVVAMVPVELSFLYLPFNGRRRLTLYLMQNLVFCSIEWLVYYPPFIVHYIYYEPDVIALNQIFVGFNLTVSSAVEMIIFLFSIRLLWEGFAAKREKNK